MLHLAARAIEPGYGALAVRPALPASIRSELEFSQRGLIRYRRDRGKKPWGVDAVHRDRLALRLLCRDLHIHWHIHGVSPRVIRWPLWPPGTRRWINTGRGSVRGNARGIHRRLRVIGREKR